MFEPVVFGIALPALAGGALWMMRARVAAPLALPVACIAGSIALWGWPGFPPLLAEGWLPFIAAAALVAGLLDRLWLSESRARLLPWILLAAFSVGSVLGARRKVWSPGESVAWHGALVLGLAALQASLERIALRRPGASLPLAGFIWSAGTAGALAVTGSLKYAQLGGLSAAALGAAATVAWIKPGLRLAHGPAATLAAWNGALLVLGYFYSDLPALPAVLLAAAPFSLLIGEAGVLADRRPWAGALVRALLVAVPVGTAFLIAAWPTLFPTPGQKYPY
jgi:hypothetical protein